MCRVTMGHLRVTTGHLRVTVGHPSILFVSNVHFSLFHLLHGSGAGGDSGDLQYKQLETCYNNVIQSVQCPRVVKIGNFNNRGFFCQ